MPTLLPLVVGLLTALSLLVEATVVSPFPARPSKARPIRAAVVTRVGLR